MQRSLLIVFLMTERPLPGPLIITTRFSLTQVEKLRSRRMWRARSVETKRAKRKPKSSRKLKRWNETGGNRKRLEIVIEIACTLAGFSFRLASMSWSEMDDTLPCQRTFRQQILCQTFRFSSSLATSQPQICEATSKCEREDDLCNRKCRNWQWRCESYNFIIIQFHMNKFEIISIVDKNISNNLLRLKQLLSQR